MRYKPLSSFDPYKYAELINLVNRRGGDTIIPSKDPKTMRNQIYHYRYALRRAAERGFLPYHLAGDLAILNTWRFRITDHGLHIIAKENV